GRLSSVIDIRMKEGNNKEFHGEGSLGFISSKITLEGPIKNGKTSYLVSARRSWVDLFTRSLLKERDLPYYYFYDLTGKMNHIFSDKSRLYLSVYTGNDHISGINTTTQFTSENIRHTYKIKHYYGWGNITSALRWNYIFNSRLFSNTSVTYSKYRYFDLKSFHNTHVSVFNGRVTNEDYKSDFQSGIEDISLRTDFDYQPFKGHSIKFGIAAIHHNFTPRAHISVVNPGNDSVSYNVDRREYTGFEPSIYLEDEIDLCRNLKIDAGLRLSAFIVKEKKYTSIEPRFSGRYLITNNWALKVAYSRMNQYVHLLTSSRITFPTDLWVPATDKVRPQLADQLAFGSVNNIGNNFELNIETYYKSMKDLIEYSEGTSFLDAGNWESKIEQGGIGRAYGVELMLKKNTGKTTGWISYTLSKTERHFDNISFGKWFPYKYDRRHDVNIIINHRFNGRIDAGLTWEFSSGNLFTLSTDVYDVSTNVYDASLIYSEFKNILYFENRNNYRLPAYHRLDLGINFHKQKKIFYRTWSISIYNVYNRMNVFFVYLGNDDIHGRKDVLLYKKYTLFPILPSLTYSLKF
ncbi:MAG: TonB-dependent receptor plug domain-containing protein, partial [Methanococcaceae archaeon]